MRTKSALGLASLAVLLVATACGGTASSGTGGSSASSKSASSNSSTASSKSSTATSSPSSSAASSSSSSAKQLTPVSFRLDWIPVGYEVPFVYGATTGIYAKYGIKANWAWGSGSTGTAKDVATGKVDFGIGNATADLKLRASGSKIKMVFGYMQDYPGSVIYPANSSIKTVKDLTKVTVGASPGSSSLLLFNPMLKAAGVNPSDVKVDNMKGSQKTIALFSHRVGAIISYGFEVQPELAAKGMKTKVFNYADYGINPINLGILVSEQTIQNKPDLVKRFVEATRASILAAEKNPQAAVQAAIKNANGTAPKANILLQQWNYTMKHLLTTKNDQGHPLGYMAPKDWKSTLHLGETYLGLKTTQPVTDAYTNQFIGK